MGHRFNRVRSRGDQDRDKVEDAVVESADKSKPVNFRPGLRDEAVHEGGSKPSDDGEDEGGKL